MAPAKKLTAKQRAQLGGFATARALGSEGMKARGAKGGLTNVERYGKEHFVRMALRRWGYKVKVGKEISPRDNNTPDE